MAKCQVLKCSFADTIARPRTAFVLTEAVIIAQK